MMVNSSACLRKFFSGTFAHILIALVLVQQSFAQPCAGVTFNTQGSIDSFRINFPDCTTIDGNVHIEGDQIVWLDSLFGILEIRGNLIVKNCPELEDISGLSQLASVAGTVHFESCDLLTNFNQLKSLQKAGSLVISDNKELIKLFFDSLELDIGSLTIERNPKLEGVNGFNSVLKLQNLVINNNQGMKSLEAFHNLDTIFGRLKLDELNNMESVSLCTNTRFIGGTLSLGILGVEHIIGFDRLEKVGAININSSRYLIKTPTFENLSSIENGINISSNKRLTEIIGFNKVTEIFGSIRITGNDSLKIISGFNSLINLNEEITIARSKPLKEISGFENLIRIGSHSLHGIYIMDSNDLVNIDAFHSLQRIEGELNLFVLRSLENLDNFQNLVSCDVVHLTRNTKLTDISGLSGLISDSLKRVQITGNSLLEICHIPPFCSYLKDSENEASILDNFMGCQTREEILENCPVSTSEDDFIATLINVHPNPASNHFQISGLKEEAFPLKYRIFSPISNVPIFEGKLNSKDDPIDCFHLPSGYYLLNLSVRNSQNTLVPFIKI